ncbi:MAG: hypothetical protein PHQ96_07355, partial [Candidatus Omnitrophica bacterium]|nr:hypothetical protein [Candidatus Omnitrophota bacterium]
RRGACRPEALGERRGACRPEALGERRGACRPEALGERRGACRSNKLALFLLAPIFSFLAVFTKGAFGIIFPLIVDIGIAIILKNKKVFFKALAVNLAAAIFVFAWLFSFTQLNKNYFSMMFFRQTVSRAVSPFSHKEPFYYYFIYLVPLFLPWSLMFIGYALNFKKAKVSLCEKMYLVWFVGGFIVLSLIRSKLEMYLLILAIPFCTLIGKFLSQGSGIVKKRIFVFTSAFFFLASLIGYLVFRNNEVTPPTAALSIPVFLLMLVLAVKSNPLAQFKNFFILWFIFIQMLNLLYLPSASGSGAYPQILNTIKNFEQPFNTIYVTEKTLLTLGVYNVGKPILYEQAKKAACNTNSCMIISKEENFPCPLRKIAKFKEYYLFYKN